jgi:hypothetical protein
MSDGYNISDMMKGAAVGADSVLANAREALDLVHDPVRRQLLGLMIGATDIVTHVASCVGDSQGIRSGDCEDEEATVHHLAMLSQQLTTGVSRLQQLVRPVPVASAPNDY